MNLATSVTTPRTYYLVSSCLRTSVVLWDIPSVTSAEPQVQQSLWVPMGNANKLCGNLSQWCGSWLNLYSGLDILNSMNRRRVTVRLPRSVSVSCGNGLSHQIPQDWLPAGELQMKLLRSECVRLCCRGRPQSRGVSRHAYHWWEQMVHYKLTFLLGIGTQVLSVCGLDPDE
jgi:hypothetical protein